MAILMSLTGRPSWVSEKVQCEECEVDFSAIAFNWRGALSKKSAKDLIPSGPEYLLSARLDVVWDNWPHLEYLQPHRKWLWKIRPISMSSGCYSFTDAE